MANFYIDLEAAGTGHAGTTGDPWSFQDFQNFAQTSPETGYNFYLRGSVDINENMMYMVGNDSTYDAWDPSLYGPWRVRCLRMGEHKDREGRISGGIFEYTDSTTLSILVPMYNCFVKCADIFNQQHMALTGCSFYCTNRFYGGETIVRDCAISFPVSASQLYPTTYINCAVNGGDEYNTYTDCQTDWVPTVAPAWDAVQSAFDVSVLYAGVTTPPQPGNPPYTGYTTDLWGNPRTGIGAGLMLGPTTTTTTTAAPTTTTTTAAPTTTTTTAAPTTTTPAPTYRPAPFASPDGNVGMPPKAGNTVGNLQHSDTKFGSSRGNLNDNSSGDNKADGTENGGPVKTVRGGGGGILGISSKPSWLSN